MKTLVEVLQESGVALSPSSNGRWVACCPFHEGDRDPSLTVYPTETYYCFGCEAWGDPIKFLIEYKGLTFEQAKTYVGVTDDNDLKKFSQRSKVIKVRNALETWQFVFRIAQIYHAHLLKTDGAWSYLTNRGLTEQTIRNNLIGYTDGRVAQFKNGDYETALQVGLVNKDGYETMSHRITVPNITSPGNADFLMGRTVINDRIKYLGTKMPKPIYGFGQVAKSPILFLAEGQFDWLILKQWGFPAIILSGSHLPKYHHMLLRDKTIIIVPDNDNVGQASSLKLQANLPDSYILDYSRLGVKDIGELGGGLDAYMMFRQTLEEQEWMKDLSSCKPHLMRWFPNSPTTQSLALT